MPDPLVTSTTNPSPQYLDMSENFLDIVGLKELSAIFLLFFSCYRLITLVSTYLGTPVSTRVAQQMGFFLQKEDSSRRIGILHTYSSATSFVKKTERERALFKFWYNFNVYYYDIMTFYFYLLKIFLRFVFFLLRFYLYVFLNFCYSFLGNFS